MRVYEIAKEVGIPNKDLIAKIRALGLEVNNHMSSLDPDDVVRIKRSLEKEKQTVAQPQQTQRLATGGAVLRRRASGEKPADPAGDERGVEREPARARPSQPEIDRSAPSASHPPATPVIRRRVEDAPSAPSAPPAPKPVVRTPEPVVTPPVVARTEPIQPQEARPPERPLERSHATEPPAPRIEPAAAPPTEPAAAPPTEAPVKQPVDRVERPLVTTTTASAEPIPEHGERTERAERTERDQRVDQVERAARPASVERAPERAPEPAPAHAETRPGDRAPERLTPERLTSERTPERTPERPMARPAERVHEQAHAAVARPVERPAHTDKPAPPMSARGVDRGIDRSPTGDSGRRPDRTDTPAQVQGDRPRSRVIVAGPQVVGRPGDQPQVQTARPPERAPAPPPSTPLPPRVVSPRDVRSPQVEHRRGPESFGDARSRFELELERARARTAEREPARSEEVVGAGDGEHQSPPPRDPSRPAVGSVISLPPRIKITERTPAAGRPPPGPQPVNPIRGRFAQQQQQRGGPRAPGGGRPGPHNDFGRKKLPLGKKGKQTTITTPAEHKRVIRIEDSITVADLARNMGIKAPEVLKKLWGMGMTGVNINAAIDFDTAQILASEFGYEVQNVAFKEEDVFAQKADNSEQMVPRSPVVTVMGHVDHGKTTLLDSIRKARVAAGEAGGITQHVAAYKVMAPGHGDIVFLDTPGHEAFTEMRARGAQATDIVVLVVAANDGVMPQTLEALAHAKDAGVKIIVAVNKIDMPDAAPDRVRQQLAEHGLIPEEWGGDTIYANVSALRGEGIENLLAQIAATADFLELRANPDKPAAGLVIEARLDRTRGPMATILIQEGTLRVGDIVVAGRTFGKVRAMLDDRGNSLEEAGPSTPIEVLGLDGVPEAGDQVNAAEDDKIAKQVVEHRRQQERKRELGSKQRFSLENMMERNSEGASKELKVVLKADVQGSAEALKASLTKLSTEKVKVNVIAAAVGGITESDVNLAKAGGAIIVGFHVRPAGKSSKHAEQEGVEIRLYDIIYDALDDVKAAMAGLLAPIKREVAMGKLAVRDTFSIPKMGTVAGCMVTEGKITRKAHLRIIRDAVQVYEGKVGSLRRFKDDVSEVQQGYECGVMIAGWNEVKQNDVIEAYEVIEEAAQL
ncbi:MAG TPA: translation initiation factor IF-2 [Kofleriaceae bacterium]|nr:translation initiation factor IF-2 [Kofleriaceae bacterium]